MATMIIKVVLCIIIPVLLLCGMLEKRSRYMALAVCAGCLMCLASYYLNTWLYGLTGYTFYYLTTSIAPFIEECAKFVPILIFAVAVSREKRTLLTFSFAVGMGFAIIENSFMLAQLAESSTVMWMLVRGVGTGLMHGMSTVIVGMGIYLAAKDRRLIVTGTAAALFFAMMYHGAYNAMILTDIIKYFSIFIPIISYGAVLAVMNKDKIKNFLEDEGVSE